MAILESRATLVGRSNAEGEIGIAQEGILDVALGARREPDANVRERAMEAADGVEHGVQREVLSGRDVHLRRPLAAPKQPRQPPGTIEERDGMRQELFPLRRERRAPPGPALLVVQRDPQLGFERNEAIANALFGDREFICRGAETPRASKFYKRCDLCLLYTSPSPRDKRQSRMPSSA